MKRMKSFIKLLSVCLSLALFINTPMISFAQTAEGTTIQPRYTSIQNHSLSLYISSGKASVSGSTTGYSGVSETHVKCNLEKLSGSYWVQLQSWSSTQSGTYASTSGEYSVSAGTYRVMGTHRCDSETITDYTSNKTYG